MRKILVLALIVGLVASAMGMTAIAAKKKRKPKPVKTVLYLHGPTPVVGEDDAADYLANGTIPSLTPAAPTEQVPKSRTYAVERGNDQCSGNPVFFPTWQGPLAGTMVGDAKLTVFTASPGGQLTARLWVDVDAGSLACNETYIPPAKEVTVDVPAGQNQVTAVFKKLKLKAQGLVMIEILTRQPQAHGSRVLYDATAQNSRFEFDCIPAKRSKKCA